MFLDNLRAALNQRVDGIPPKKTRVNRRDLKNLLYHFDRLDREARQDYEIRKARAGEYNALQRGIIENLPNTVCQGEYLSAQCQDAECVLGYYCKARKECDNAYRMLDLANEALERSGNAVRFGIKIPEDAFVFEDTEETLRIDADDEPAYSTKQWNELQAQCAAMRAILETEKQTLATECLGCAWERSRQKTTMEPEICGCGKTDKIGAITEALSATAGTVLLARVRELEQAITVFVESVEGDVIQKQYVPVKINAFVALADTMELLPTAEEALNILWDGEEAPVKDGANDE